MSRSLTPRLLNLGLMELITTGAIGPVCPPSKYSIVND